jgi:hypothetical protein
MSAAGWSTLGETGIGLETLKACLTRTPSSR